MKTPHKHAEILRAIADGKPVQFRLTHTHGKSWEDLDTSSAFSIFSGLAVEYRIKPKPLIKKWRWVYQNTGGSLVITNNYYADQRERNSPGVIFVQKIESTMIEVEQDD